MREASGKVIAEEREDVKQEGKDSVRSVCTRDTKTLSVTNTSSAFGSAKFGDSFSVVSKRKQEEKREIAHFTPFSRCTVVDTMI